MKSTVCILDVTISESAKVGNKTKYLHSLLTLPDLMLKGFQKSFTALAN